MSRPVSRPMGPRTHPIFFFRQTKEEQAVDSQTPAFLGFLGQLIHRQTKNPRHGGNFLPLLLTGHHKKGINQLSRAQNSFPHQGAEVLVAPQPTGSIFRINHNLQLLSEKRNSRRSTCGKQLVSCQSSLKALLTAWSIKLSGASIPAAEMSNSTVLLR